MRKRVEPTGLTLTTNKEDNAYIISSEVTDRQIVCPTDGDGREGWSKGNGPTTTILPLYKHPASDDPCAGTMSIFEGPSDWLTAIRCGIPHSYFVTKGASTRLDESWLFALAESGVKTVYIFFDTDQAGKNGARKLAQQFDSVGIEAVIVDITPLIKPLRFETDVNDAFQHMRDDPDGFRARLMGLAATTTTETKMRGYTFDELKSLCPDGVRWRCHPIIPEQGTVAMVAPPGGGKSMTLFELFHCANTGSDFIGHRCERFNVLYAAEDPTSVLVERGRSYDFPENVRTVTFDEVLTLGMDWDERARSLIKLARKHDCQVVVIDTGPRWMDIRDNNDYSCVIDAMNRCALFRKHSIAVVVTFHSPHSDDGRIMGSQAYGASADITFSITGSGDTRKIEFIRNKLSVDNNNYVLHTRRENGRIVRCDSPTQEKSQRFKDELQNLLIDAGDKGLSAAEAAEMLGISKETARKRLRKLAESDMAVRQEVQARGGKGERFWDISLQLIFKPAGSDEDAALTGSA